MSKLVPNILKIKQLIGFGSHRFYANRLEMHPVTFSRKINGHASFSVDEVNELARLLGVEPMVLLSTVEDNAAL